MTYNVFSGTLNPTQVNQSNFTFTFQSFYCIHSRKWNIFIM